MEQIGSGHVAYPIKQRRPREHLSRDEVLTLCKSARKNRHGTRDAAAIWIAFNHGLACFRTL